MFLFCKQKTAYGMRISDWSSDVCSSDLAVRAVHRRRRQIFTDVRTRAVRSPALHPVLVRHHGDAEVHRSQPWRRTPDEPEGACAPCRREAGRSTILLHDARLDDVELAAGRFGRRLDAPAV